MQALEHNDEFDEAFSTAVVRLGRDLRQAAETLSPTEARFLVDAYYMIQKDRIRAGNQRRALAEAGEPAAVLSWLFEQSSVLEQQIKNALDRWSASQPVGVWARSVKGIGPVLAAGLLAHIDIRQAPTVGHIWRFAGLDPTSTWKKGEKRPHNGSLKTLCWKIGESFVKVSGADDAFYGHLYVQRKVAEIKRNEAGENAAYAEKMLSEKRFGKETEAYKHYSAGRLPPAHIHARAKRWAVKLFLAHLHERMYRDHYDAAPPLPYPIAHLDHAHVIKSV